MEENIFLRALNTYGEDNQLSMAQEECAELIQAISHHKRGRIGRYKLMLEAADVQIMLNQIREINPSEFDACVKAKTENLQIRLEKKKAA